MYHIFFIHFLCQWTFSLLPCLGYYKQCCNKHWNENTMSYSLIVTVNLLQILITNLLGEKKWWILFCSWPWWVIIITMIIFDFDFSFYFVEDNEDWLMPKIKCPFPGMKRCLKAFQIWTAMLMNCMSRPKWWSSKLWIQAWAYHSWCLGLMVMQMTDWNKNLLVSWPETRIFWLVGLDSLFI